MRKSYVHFVREIYTYCDNNVKERVLFPAFMNLWDENGYDNYITKRDLAVLTSTIISRLLKKGILRVVHSSTSPKDAYGLYKILPHENLMKYTDLAEKKMKLLKL